MTGTIELDMTEWPLAKVVLPSEPVSTEELLRFVQTQRDMLAREELHGLICDARRTIVMPPNQRRIFGEWLVEAEEATAKYTVRLGIVFSNPLIRGAMTAVMWIKKPACETKVFATWGEARAWVEDGLRKQGLLLGHVS